MIQIDEISENVSFLINFDKICENPFFTKFLYLKKKLGGKNIE